MKKITLLVGMLSIMAFISCKKKEETPQPTETTVEVTTPAAQPEETNPDGTSVSVGTDGVDVSTKDGASETNVKVGGGDAKVEIKK